MLFGVMSAIMLSPVSTRFLFLLKISDSYFTFFFKLECTHILEASQITMGGSNTPHCN